MKSHPVADQVEELLVAFRYEEALNVLKQARAQEPHNPDLYAAAGLCALYQGREEEAIEHLGKAGNGSRARRLARMIAEHLICRNQMASKLRVRDDLANRFLKKVQMISLMPTKPVGITLSACLIVKNEEANLERCLKSLQGIVDEIVVVDTGSTDRTVEIARAHGAILGSFPWNDDFSAARNAALSLATGHWVLWIDADEELTSESVDAIRNAVCRPQFGGFAIEIVNFTEDEGEAGQFHHAPVRLFQRVQGVRFSGRIHEQIAPSLHAIGLPIANLEGVRILHHGYRPEEMEAKNKVGRAIDMLEREVEEAPQDYFHWFNLANAYTVGEKWTDAENAARTCAEHLPAGDPYGPLVYQYLSTAQLNQGLLKQALETCDEADARGYGGILNEFERANVFLKLGLLEDAIAAADRCMAAEWPEGFTGDYSIFSHKRQVVRGQILALQRRFSEALAMFDEALAANPDYAPAVYSKAATLEKDGQHAEALELFLKGSEDTSIHAMCCKGAGRVYMSLGLPKQAAETFERAWIAEPDDYDAWVGWAQAADTWGDTSTILAAYEAFAGKHEPTCEILVNWGRALQQSGNHDRALHCFTEAIKRDPSNSNAYFNCGDLLYKMEQYQDAAHIYETGLRQSPMNADGWFVLGNCLARLGLADGAKMAYEQALSLRPAHREARHNLEVVSEAA